MKIHMIQADMHSEQEEVVQHQILIVWLLINTYCNCFYVFKNKEKRSMSTIILKAKILNDLIISCKFQFFNRIILIGLLREEKKDNKQKNVYNKVFLLYLILISCRKFSFEKKKNKNKIS
jgi:hypothetical protein